MRKENDNNNNNKIFKKSFKRTSTSSSAELSDIDGLMKFTDFPSFEKENRMKSHCIQ